MEAHDPRHAELLADLVTGELSASSAKARALLESCAECASRFRELSSLQDHLSRVGSEEREGVRAAASTALTSDQEARFRAQLAAHTARSGARRRWTRVAALALAASILGMLGYQMSRPSPTPERREETPLGGETDAVRALEPHDEVDSLERFSWSARALEPDETFSLTITDLDRPDEPLTVDRLTGLAWSRADARLVDAARMAEFFDRAPRRIEWQVEIQSGIRSVARSAALQASLR